MSTEPERREPPERQREWPGRAAFRDALAALTVVRGAGASSSIGISAIYYPVVGMLLGALWLAADRAAGAVGGRLLGSAAVLLVANLLTGGRPLAALGGLVAAALSGRGGTRALIYLEPPPPQAARVCAALVALFELCVLWRLERFRMVGLAFAPLLGCCSVVVLAVGSRAARIDGRRVKLAPQLTFNEFALASTLTFAATFIATEFLGLLLVLSTAALTIALRVFFHRWLDGVNDTALSAAREVVQLTVLGLLATFG